MVGYLAFRFLYYITNKDKNMYDNVKNPRHYALSSGTIEPIDFCRMFSFCFGNFVKYVLRADFKNNFKQDLQKALVYLDWSIEDIYTYSNLANDIIKYEHLARRFNNRFLNEFYNSLKDNEYKANDFDNAFLAVKKAIKLEIEEEV